ncbi:MAG: PDZ domain-containing protein [Ardenticatenaceae bacterium]|nr:PDZ domain-containing protein [Ardenticatenaceae bacterium]MCB8989251.1 PDZ domain-containing protein [Ardenticatenaceae bacterium]
MNVFTEPKLLRNQHKPFVLFFIYLISFVLMGLIAAAVLIAVRHPYTGLVWEQTSNMVVEVDADSPAEAAGFQPGDKLLTVAGQAITSLPDGQPLVEENNAASIEVLRAGKTLVLTLSAEFPPTNEFLKRLTPLFVAVCFALFSFGIWVYQPHDWRVILFWAFNQLGAAGLTFGTLSNLGYLWSTRWFGITLCLFSPVLIHFHTQVTGADLKSLQRRALQGLYALSFILVVIWSYAVLRNVSQVYAVVRLIIQVYFITAVFLTIILLTRAYFFASRQSWRWQVRLIALGIFLAFAPLVGLALLPNLLFGRVLVAYELTFPFLLFMPLAHTIAIYNANLLQIERLINRRVVHLALLVILSAIYLVIFASIANIWSIPQDLAPLLWGATTLVFGILFAVLRDRLQETIDKIIYGGWYNYRTVVAEMSRGLGSVVDSEELADLLVNRLADILHLECAAFLLGSDDMQLTLIRTVGYHTLPPIFSADNPLVTKLLDEQAVSSIELRALLADTMVTHMETLWLEHPQIKIWVPIKRSGKIQALLLLGKRLDGELFDEEDRRMLNTLAWGAAAAVENVRLVRVLQQRTDEVNLLYSQLLQSREEERKRLARELHDGVIQQLINLHYYLDPASRRLAPTMEENALVLRGRLQQAIDELRVLCTQLRPAALDDLSLALALQGYIEDVKEQYDLHIELNATGGEFPRIQRLPEAIEVCLFRVTQEAINNVCRHAEANGVWIDLSLQPGHAVLEIHDDGKGFYCPPHLGSFMRQRHFGLAGLQERLNLIGGTLAIDSMPGEGTTLRAEVSYTPSAPQTHDPARDSNTP